jgi:16S rRNA processing protein RimM
MSQPPTPDDPRPGQPAPRPPRPSAPRRGAGPVRPGGPRGVPPRTVAPPPLAQTPGPSLDTPLAEARLSVGMIERPHGVRGESRVRLYTDKPEHLTSIKQIYLGDETQPRKLLGIRFHQEHALMRIAGIVTPEAVRALHGTQVRIAGKDATPLQPGERFYYQLIGMAVVTESGDPVGELTDIMETGANEVYVVTPPGGGDDVLLPNIPDVILAIDDATRTITIRPLVYA